MDAVFHLERPSPRARYLITHLFGRMMGRVLTEVVEREAFVAHPGPRLLYGSSAVEGAFLLAPSERLERGEAPADAPADPLAAAFHLLTLAHEQGLPRDPHGRPMHAALSLPAKEWTERPAVDQWALELDRAWRAMDPRLPAPRRSYGQVATLDLDNGFKYLGRPLWRTLGSAARDLLGGRWSEVTARLAVLRGERQDPYLIDEGFLEQAGLHAERAVVHVLAADRGPHDHAVPLSFTPMADRVRKLGERCAVGLHPSYASSEKAGVTRREQHRLEAVTGTPVTVSRQHFLRMRVPDTFRELEQLGIREEHSLGFADRTGFRCGTCTPFPWYDVEQERETGLVCWPFQVMDSALAYRMGLTPEEAAREALRVAGLVREVDGTFVSVWHERFLSGHGREAGWEVVFPRVVQGAAP